VALATVTAAGIRYATVGTEPVFAMPDIAEPGMAALACYVGVGALIGLVSVGITHLVYGIEDAFETTGQAHGLLPLLGGCAAAYLVSALTMRNTIMTEKIARRGVRVPTEYAADYLEQVLVRDVATRQVVTLRTSDELGEVRRLLNSGGNDYQHQGFPVIDDNGTVRGVITRRGLLDPAEPNMRRIGDMGLRPPVVVHEHHSLREAADHMVAEDIGRVIVVGVDPPHPLVGILTRGDILSAHRRRLKGAREGERHIRIGDTIRRYTG
jgi:CBS domain-containing protein